MSHALFPPCISDEHDNWVGVSIGMPPVFWADSINYARSFFYCIFHEWMYYGLCCASVNVWYILPQGVRHGLLQWKWFRSSCVYFSFFTFSSLPFVFLTLIVYVFFVYPLLTEWTLMQFLSFFFPFRCFCSLYLFCTFPSLKITEWAIAE